MKPRIIDTREPVEYQMSHVEGSINVPSTKFTGGVPRELQDVPHEQPMILYCRSGQRSNTCIQILKMNGFTNLTNGINEHQTRKLLQRHDR